MSYVIYSARDPSARPLEWLVAGVAATKPAADQVARALGRWGGVYRVAHSIMSSSPGSNYELVPVYLIKGGHKYYYGLYTPSTALALRDALPDLTGGEIDNATMNERLAMLR